MERRWGAKLEPLVEELRLEVVEDGGAKLEPLAKELRVEVVEDGFLLLKQHTSTTTYSYNNR